MPALMSAIGAPAAIGGPSGSPVSATVQVITRQMGLGPRAAVRRDRDVDQSRVRGTKCIRAKSTFLEHSQTKVLNQDVTFHGQFTNDLVALRPIEIDTHAALATVLLDVIRTVTVLHDRQQPGQIPYRSRFDLDDVGAETCHEQRARRARQVLGEVEHTHIFEHSRTIGHWYRTVASRTARRCHWARKRGDARFVRSLEMFTKEAVSNA